jgi:hypothetical protein
MKSFVTFLAISICFLGLSQAYFQQEVNYKIKVQLNDVEHILTGNEQFEYVNNSSSSLQEIYVHVWANAYKNEKTALGKQLYKDGNFALSSATEAEKGWIDSLNFKVNAQAVKWEFDVKNQDVCVLHLTTPLKPGERLTVTTPFKIKIPSGKISRLGHIGQSYQITQWYPKPAVYDKNGWNPIPYLTQGEFYSEYGSFDVSITLPKNYVVGATGDLQTPLELAFLEEKVVETKNNMDAYLKNKAETPFPASDKALKTIRYIQKNIHDFGWFADKRFAVSKSEVILPASKENVTTWAMWVPQNTEKWQHADEYLRDGIYYYSLWNGDYPYKQVTAVDGTISAGGGMEYPNVTVIGNTSSKEELEIVIVHEVGHNWFYGILGSNERVHGWMDEGMNTFNEVRYIQTKYPNNTRFSDMVLNGRFHMNHLNYHDMNDILVRTITVLGEDQAIETHSADFTPTNYGLIMYQKTGLVFEYLRDYLGAEKFDQCMHAYFDEWKFKHPQPADMQATLERVSGKKLDWLFSDLIQTTKHIDYKISSVQKRLKTGTLVKIKNVGQVNGPIEVNAYKNDTLVETKWIEPTNDKKMCIHLNTSNPDAIQINSDRTMPELNRQNNNWHVTGLFKKIEPINFEFLIGDKEQKKSTVFWTPMIAGNFYDKFMIGATFHNFGIPMNPFQYVVTPMYSFGRNMVSGMAEVSYSFLPEKNIKLSRIGLSVKSFKNDSTAVRKSDGAYLALSPYWLLKLGNRKRSNFAHSLLFQGITKATINEGTRNDYVGGFEEYTIDYRSTNHLATLKIRNTNLISRDQLKMGRLTAEVNYKYLYLKGRMARSIELRGFAGTNYLFRNPSGNNTYAYGMSLSGTDGAQDLFFEDYYFGRGMIDGIWSQQRAENMGGFKSTSYYGTTTSWMATANLYVQLPIPKLKFIGYYLDAGVFNNEITVNSAINMGLAMRISNAFGVYFPLWMSKELNDSFGNSKYAEKIRFTLKMNIVNKGLRFNL